MFNKVHLFQLCIVNRLLLLCFSRVSSAVGQAWTAALACIRCADWVQFKPAQIERPGLKSELGSKDKDSRLSRGVTDFFSSCSAQIIPSYRTTFDVVVVYQLLPAYYNCCKVNPKRSFCCCCCSYSCLKLVVSRSTYSSCARGLAK